MGREHGSTASARSVRDRNVNRVLWRVLFLNLLVAILKVVFGFLSGALSLIADGFHSTLDALSNVVGLVGLHAAGKEPDDDHPYGHRKFEALAALGIAMFLFFTSYEVVTQVVQRFRTTHEVQATPLTFAVVIVSIIVSILVSRYEARQGHHWRSLILLADSRHTQSDVFTSLGVIVSLIAALLRFPVLDLVIALAIAIYIAYSGYKVVAGSFVVLSDSQVVDPAVVVKLAQEVPGLTHAHRVRSRGLPDDIHVDLHVHCDPDMTIARAHGLAHEVEERIRAAIPGVIDVVVHIEPDDEHEG